jgi:hypothetical protein
LRGKNLNQDGFILSWKLRAALRFALRIKIIKQATNGMGSIFHKCVAQATPPRIDFQSVGSGATHAAKICTTAPEQINQNSFIQRDGMETRASSNSSLSIKNVQTNSGWNLFNTYTSKSF